MPCHVEHCFDKLYSVTTVQILMPGWGMHSTLIASPMMRSERPAYCAINTIHRVGRNRVASEDTHHTLLGHQYAFTDVARAISTRMFELTEVVSCEALQGGKPLPSHRIWLAQRLHHTFLMTKCITLAIPHGHNKRCLGCL